MIKKFVFSILLSAASQLPAYAADNSDQNQPSSSLENGVEVFAINCHGMPQQTTIDMDECQAKKLRELDWVLNKYQSAIVERISGENKDNPAYKQRLVSAYEEEAQAWSALINAASKSVDVDFEGGTISSSMYNERRVRLSELQIHDMWQNWLTYMDSSPALLPEPKFDIEQ